MADIHDLVAEVRSRRPYKGRPPEHGQVVRVSPAGRQALSGYVGRYGVIVGKSRDRSCWSIEWAGARGASAISKDFVEVVTLEHPQ